MTQKHIIYAAATQLEPWRKRQQIPQTLSSGYFSNVNPGDVIWVIQRLDIDEAEILSRFEVDQIRRNGKKIDAITVVEPVFRPLSMKKHRIRAAYVGHTGGLGGFVECSCGGELTTTNSDWERGFRTGWQLTPAAVAAFEGAWAKSIGHVTQTSASAVSIKSSSRNDIDSDEGFNVQDLVDERERMLREIVARRGQDKFRTYLIQAYCGRCAVTGCNAEAALEAAHIVAYSGPESNHAANGLLLRRDIHALFDLHLIRIDPKKLTVVVTQELRDTDYDNLQNRKLRLPKNPNFHPDKKALLKRWKSLPD